MTHQKSTWGVGLVCALVVAGSASALAQSDSSAPGSDLTFAMAYQDDATASSTTSTTEMSSGPDLPISFDITYYLYSDYIFRGINFSEYAGEGVEKLNHQMTTSLDVDIADLFGNEPGSWGTFNFSTFFEWYAAQKQIDPEKGGQSLQEVDYSLGWSYDLEPIASTVGIGYTFYVFPSDTALNTDEWFVSLEHNDAWMWKWLWPDNEDGILNPSLFYAHDVGQAAGGGWLEIGMSHEFDVPYVEYLSATPSVTFAIDRRFIGRTVDVETVERTGLAYVQFGLDLSYALSDALQIPDEYGALTLGGFLYWNEVGSQYDDERTSVIEDEFFGGMSLGWSF